ncbi:uncharacterized protein I206_104394 [Kwoniella pini CBS 10737]|uniref:Uncharacterized protein n=1 Tax=Kwoniella pini CBS 10737 TaxID=1296096 RepID=A0A1B9I1T3_9TREE|nr:uncharacterized protein I206_04024 [Kwoniella pini CBS 10737]OCF49503.1 hypothetical protein I206_04024 [Kwoniella pini CBS 10737]
MSSYIPLHLLGIIFLPSVLAAANEQYDQGTITIPTSTVLSIGLGFLAFSMLILLFLLGFRANRIRRISKRTGKTFKETWTEQGGFWGFLTSFGENENNAFNQSFIIGGGGRTMHYEYNLRRWGYLSTREEDNLNENKIKPEMWDYNWSNQINEKILNHPNLIEDPSEIQPISITPSRYPDPSDKYLPNPTLDLCVLIAFPSEVPYDPMKAEELPELIIGSATLLPTIVSEVEDISSSTNDEAIRIVNQQERLKKQSEIQHLEHAPRERAEWKRDDRMIWYIDGLH